MLCLAFTWLLKMKPSSQASVEKTLLIEPSLQTYLFNVKHSWNHYHHHYTNSYEYSLFPHQLRNNRTRKKNVYIGKCK